MKIKGHAIRSTTAPSKPQAPSISNVSDTSITITWPANTEPNISGYNILRSTDGSTYTVLVTDLATNSYTDTNLTSGQIYYYRIVSKNSTGQVSELSIVVSQETTASGQLTWAQSLPSPIDFNYGVANTFDFDPYITGTPTSITASKSLPPGVTIVGQTLSYDGTGASSGHTETNIIFTLNDSIQADWNTRSNASGVFYKNNFTYKDVALTQLITNTTDLIASSSQTGGPQWVEWDTSNKLSGGGSCKLNMPASSFGANSGYSIDFTGVGIKNVKSVVKHEFYLQFAYYPDTVWTNTYYGDTNSYGGKICIVEAPNRSFDTGEVVLIRLPRTPGAFVASYRIPYTTGLSSLFSLDYPSINEGALNSMYDVGSPTVTSLNTMQQRHGVDYRNRNAIGVSDPDLANAPRLQGGRWYVFEMYIRQTSSDPSIVKIWFAEYGQQPQLLIGSMNAYLPFIGAVDSQGYQLYTGAQFTNYPNSPTSWNSTDTFVSYDEIIASDNPINFPGGYSIPFPGTQTPTGYPPSGAVEATP